MTTPTTPSAVRTLSPRDVARALGVGESSVKRWIDSGRLPAAKTVGGHRRIEVIDALRFVRDGRREIADPSLLGLETPASLDLTDRDVVRAALIESLEEGDEATTVAITSQLATVGGDIPEVLDDPLWAAFRDIRGRCNHPSNECVTLHRAQAQCIVVARRLAELADPIPEQAPLGLTVDIGYEIDGLGCHFAETVLTHGGFAATQVGFGVPSEVAVGAIARVRPDVVWLSANGAFKLELDAVAETANKIAAEAATHGSALVISGDALPDPRAIADDVTEVESMAEFAAFLAGFDARR